MDTQYKISYDKKFYKDLHLIEIRTTDKYYSKLKEKMSIVLENLQFMPRTHKTIYTLKDPIGEYRRIVLDKYSIIYKIIGDEIIILRIFNQRENYLNQKRFILREENQRYFIDKRRRNMIKFRTLKNSYSKLKENFSRIITGNEVWSRYMDRIIEEAEESLKNEGYITIEELREELIREYNVNI